MTPLYRNIDLVVLNIKAGTQDYFLPKMVDWANVIVDKLVICAPLLSNELSPIDGVTPVMPYADMVQSNLYVDLYDSDEQIICHGLHVSGLIHNNNFEIPIGKKLSRDLSQLHFATAPENDACILIYVFSKTNYVLDIEPSKRNVTIQFPMQADEKLSLRYIVNTYVHASGEKVRGITMYNAYASPVYVTLRDHDLTYFINSVHSELMRPDLYGNGGAPDTQLMPFRLDSLDIDFDYSFVRNACASAISVIMTVDY